MILRSINDTTYQSDSIKITGNNLKIDYRITENSVYTWKAFYKSEKNHNQLKLQKNDTVFTLIYRTKQSINPVN
jgi:hypothetical protein